MWWRGGEYGEQDGREEEESGMHGYVVGFVPAEDLMNNLRTRSHVRVRSFLASIGNAVRIRGG